jgi:hypothetical protein
MSKLSDWESRLAALVTQAHSRPFAWGQRDCCLWAADCVKAQTGTDPAEGLRGTYATARAAMALVEQLGGMAEIGARCGTEIHPLMAMHGDIGLVQHEGRELLALCNGDHWLVVGPEGLLHLPVTVAVLAWRVGHG